MIEQTLGKLLEDKVELDLEGIDRLYLNAYQPRLQTGGGVVAFFKGHRGAQVASTTLMAPMSKAFVADICAYAKRHGIEMVRFTKGQRKDDVTQQRLEDFQEPEGVLYIGVAQEKFAGFRVTKKVSPQTGSSFPWLHRSTVMCNQYYFYLMDEDFGPLFIVSFRQACVTIPNPAEFVARLSYRRLCVSVVRIIPLRHEHNRLISRSQNRSG